MSVQMKHVVAPFLLALSWKVGVGWGVRLTWLGPIDSLGHDCSGKINMTTLIPFQNALGYCCSTST